MVLHNEVIFITRMRTQAEVNVKGEDEKLLQEKQEGGYKSIIGTFETELKWLNIVAISIFHLVSLWSFVAFPYLQNLRLVAWGILIMYINAFGVTGGAHRLWCHSSYKAKLPLRILLMVGFTAAGQNSIFHWVRDHRVHHKYSETVADPHDIKRGFFFAHMGWLMMKKHPEVIRRGNEIDMSDVLADPVVQFHEKFFLPLKILFAFVIPSIVPPLWWGQDWFWSVMTMCTLRYCLVLNMTWLVNSAAHMWGKRPYNKNMCPAENMIVAILTSGEGWHNYHHTFPWDYKTAELGAYSANFTTLWIDMFAKLGLAYDLKFPSKELVKRVVEKTGDGSHFAWGHSEVSENSEDLLKKEF